MDRLTKVMQYNDGNKLYDCSNEVVKNVKNFSSRLKLIFEKLAMYEDLEEQDRLLKLPCKVGDTVYWINGRFIVDYKITGFSVDEDGVWLMYVEHYDKAVDKTYSYNIAVDTIGKIAFFSKSEAEAKLKELRNIKNSKNINLDNDDFERM